MITITIPISTITAARLGHCAREHGRSLVDECVFILSEGGSTAGHLFPGTTSKAAAGDFVLPEGGSTARSASEATA